jgi:hypothetical protein
VDGHVVGWRRRGRSGGEPEMGPRGMTVIEDLLARLDSLEPCEHLTGPDAERYWIAVDDARLLCEFCWGAVQVLMEDSEVRCGFCGWPIEDRSGQDAVVLARLAPVLAAHFWLCRVCAAADLAGSGQ